jgi:exopolyphosphatase/guanosine-5'-triphosphate,3'-diphosphate pyrophosphatase
MIVNSTAKPKGKKDTRCCIDLGSSYFRMLSVDVESGREGTSVRNILQERIYTGWGEEVLSTGLISRQTAVRAADILKRLSGVMMSRGDVRLTVVATNTLRLADNRDEVKSLLEKRTGLDVNVLSQRGEAFLGFAGAAWDLSAGEPAILADAGGTSTELSWGAAPKADSFLSIPVGTHTVRTDFRENIRRASSLITRILEDAGIPKGDSPLPGKEESPTIMFTGGTAVSLAIVWKQMRSESYDGLVPVGVSIEPGPVEMSVEELNLVGRRLASLFRSGRERMIQLSPERVRLLLPGLAIVLGTARALRAKKLTMTARGLRWGVVLGDGMIERGYLADEQESPDSR